MLPPSLSARCPPLPGRLRPTSVEDLKWWTGWTLTDTRTAITATGSEPVSLGEGTGYLLPDDLEPVTAPEPWVALLPGLDPTAMGWRQPDFHLDAAHIRELYDRNGNIGPTIWADGRIIGAWTQHRTGHINTHPPHRPRPGRPPRRRRPRPSADHLARRPAHHPHYRTPLERRLSQDG